MGWLFSRGYVLAYNVLGGYITANALLSAVQIVSAFYAVITHYRKGNNPEGSAEALAIGVVVVLSILNPLAYLLGTSPNP